jgi:uncharacterized membrane protein
MKAMLFASLAGLCWGIGEVCTKSVLHTGTIGPLTALAMRSLVALPIIWLVWVLARDGFAGGTPEPRGWLSADAATWSKLVLGSGVVAGAIAMIAFYIALTHGPVSQVKPIAFCLAPATGALLGWLLLGEDMTLRKAIAIGLILLGVVLLTGGATSTTTRLGGG